MEIANYEGQRVVVCGVASGMGEATAQELVRQGADVIGLDVQRPSTWTSDCFVEIDLREQASIDRAVDFISGQIDGLFVCSGVPGRSNWTDIEVMLINFVGPRYLIESLVPAIRQGGAIASISSQAGNRYIERIAEILDLLTSAPGFDEGRKWFENHPAILSLHYGGSKECLQVYTMWRSYSLIRDNQIRINCTAPGPTTTPMMPLFEEVNGKEVMDAVPRPIGRNSLPAEQAFPLLFLNCSAASYVTGNVFATDGGMAAAIATHQVDMKELLELARKRQPNG